MRLVSSCVDSCKLSPRVDVGKDMFDKASLMRGMHTYLRVCLQHPALKEFHSECARIRAALERFENQRASVLQIGKDDKKAKDIDTLQRDLAKSKGTADALIRRYDLIRIVTRMDKGIDSRPPILVDGLYFYRWDCGKTGATKKLTELKAYNLVSFEPGAYKAFELEWQSPVTEGSSTLHNFKLSTFGGTTPREKITFQTQSSGEVLPRPPPPPSPSKKLLKLPPPGQQPEAKDPGVFDFRLTDHQPVYILGWTLSCYWPEGPGKSEPTIEVDHPTNHIFSDRFVVSVDNSRSARWHCKVIFVIQSAYNFPDLSATLLS